MPFMACLFQAHNNYTLCLHFKKRVGMIYRNRDNWFEQTVSWKEESCPSQLYAYLNNSASI